MSGKTGGEDTTIIQVKSGDLDLNDGCAEVNTCGVYFGGGTTWPAVGLHMGRMEGKARESPQIKVSNSMSLSEK